MLFNRSGKKEGEQWLTSSKISNDVNGKPRRRWPGAERSHVECFQLFSGVKEKVLGTGSNERPAAYYIAFNCLFVLHFYCQLDLQWKNYTMLVFCFIMLLFLIFQNIRNFILLYVMAEKYFLPWSIRKVFTVGKAHLQLFNVKNNPKLL